MNSHDMVRNLVKKFLSRSKAPWGSQTCALHTSGYLYPQEGDLCNSFIVPAKRQSTAPHAFKSPLGGFRGLF
jgi:hypothetical protein